MSAASPDGPEDLALNERCLPVVHRGTADAARRLQQQRPVRSDARLRRHLNEMIHDARIVPMDGRPHGAVPRWMGDSRGHWEGATLVVDTVGFTDKTGCEDPERRCTSSSDSRASQHTIEYRFTVEDPTIWTRPWSASFPMTRTDGPMYEYACHEGNARSMDGILRGARATEHEQR